MSSCRVWLELTSRQPTAGREAELVDMSRHGLQVRLTGPLEVSEPVVVRIQDSGATMDVALQAKVRWQRPHGQNRWAVGCAFDEAVNYEVLGELFLRGFLNAGPGRG